MENAMCDFTVPCLWERGDASGHMWPLHSIWKSPVPATNCHTFCGSAYAHRALWCSRRCKAKKRWEFQFHAQVIPSQSTCKNCAFFNFRVNHEIKQISLPVPSLFWLCCCCFFLKPRRSGTLFPIFLLQSLWDPIPKVSGLHLDGTISQLPW